MRMSRIGSLLAVALLCGLTLPAGAVSRESAPPKIQIAVLLDTSSSMEGLINQARTQIWKIVNQFATSKKNGVRPEIQVALLEYGKSSLPAQEGFIRLIQPLTKDLDSVSEQLFALNTNGGDEYCGQVIEVATRRLEWSSRPGDLKVIVIAGNEPFTQGPVPYDKACQAAIHKGIMVNTIFCGPAQEGITTKWQAGATLADGQYMSIDQNQAVAQVTAPQDAEIARLGQEINKTYIAYGHRGKEAKMRQAAQDSNAASAAPAAMAERAVFKSSANYSNEEWDLADAVKSNKVDVSKLEEEALPAEMKGMNEQQRKAYVAEQSKKRGELQTQIQKLNAERVKYVAQKEKELAASGENTLDAVMIKALREQAKRQGFSFE